MLYKTPSELREALSSVLSAQLNLPSSEIVDGLAYQSVVEWDSLAHVDLMMTIEKTFGVRLTPKIISSLDSVKSILNYLSSQLLANTSEIPGENQPTTPTNSIHRGLNGIYLDTTKISSIDEQNNQLQYRGYPLENLATQSSYENTLYLLVYGSLPNKQQLHDLKLYLQNHRHLTPEVIRLIESLKDSHPLDVMRTAVSFLGAKAPHRLGINKITLIEDGLAIIAKLPAILGTHHCIRQNKAIPDIAPNLSQAQYILTMLQGHLPDEADVQFLEKDLIIHAEHGTNASTFAARVAIGAQTNIFEAFTSAFSVFPGRIHGGALEDILNFISEIKQPAQVKEKINERRSQGLPIPGFGHRIYRQEDPRSALLKSLLKDIVARTNDRTKADILETLVDEMQDSIRFGLAPNVDLYAGVCYRLLGLPDDMATSIFLLGRSVGILAHIIEQAERNILIRPLLQYDGPLNKQLIQGVDHNGQQ